MDHEDQDDGGDDDGNSTNINQMNNSGDDEDDGGATGSTGGGVGNSGYEGSNSGQGMPLQSNENMDENSPISTANGEERYSSKLLHYRILQINWRWMSNQLISTNTIQLIMSTIYLQSMWFISHIELIINHKEKIKINHLLYLILERVQTFISSNTLGLFRK